MKRFLTISVALIFAALTLTFWSVAEDGGAQLYKSSCSACHGEKGEGNPGANMPAVKGTAMSMEQLSDLITKGSSEKIFHANPMGGIDPEQAQAIAKYIKSMK
ncbi:MAG TPA: cytochrome c [Acidobacteriota bacterium]|nr:cytochrome c [Acidobacteriota bacterium]